MRRRFKFAVIKKQLECVCVSHLVPISRDEDDEEELDEGEGSVGTRWRGRENDDE